MMVNVDGVWVNPDHVSRLEVEGDCMTAIRLSNGDWFRSQLPPDDVAAILNGGTDYADA